MKRVDVDDVKVDKLTARRKRGEEITGLGKTTSGNSIHSRSAHTHFLVTLFSSTASIEDMRHPRQNGVSPESTTGV